MSMIERPSWMRTAEEVAAIQAEADNARSMVFTGIDVGTDGFTAECVARHNADGTITILEMNQWKHDIDLEPNR